MIAAHRRGSVKVPVRPTGGLVAGVVMELFSSRSVRTEDKLGAAAVRFHVPEFEDLGNAGRRVSGRRRRSRQGFGRGSRARVKNASSTSTGAGAAAVLTHQRLIVGAARVDRGDHILGSHGGQVWQCFGGVGAGVATVRLDDRDMQRWRWTPFSTRLAPSARLAAMSLVGASLASSAEVA